MDMFQINGDKFDPIVDPVKLGIFETTKAYFLIFSQRITPPKQHKSRHAIILWRGSDIQMNLGAAMRRF